MSLTWAQRRQVERAKASPVQRVEWVGTRGLAKSSWDRMMRRLCEMGVFVPYVHGGYELTEKGAKL